MKSDMTCPICDRQDKDEDFRECTVCCENICESCFTSLDDLICYECESQK